MCDKFLRDQFSTVNFHARQFSGHLSRNPTRSSLAKLSINPSDLRMDPGHTDIEEHHAIDLATKEAPNTRITKITFSTKLPLSDLKPCSSNHITIGTGSSEQKLKKIVLIKK